MSATSGGWSLIGQSRQQQSLSQSCHLSVQSVPCLGIRDSVSCSGFPGRSLAGWSWYPLLKSNSVLAPETCSGRLWPKPSGRRNQIEWRWSPFSEWPSLGRVLAIWMWPRAGMPHEVLIWGFSGLHQVSLNLNFSKSRGINKAQLIIWHNSWSKMVTYYFDWGRQGILESKDLAVCRIGNDLVEDELLGRD